MTREEAIEILKAVDENASCDDCLYYAQMEDCPTDDDCIIRKAIWMAIKALEQEPCEDAISREAVIYEFKEMYKAAEEWGHNSKDDYIKARADATMATLIEQKLRVEGLPSVQPSRKGHWIEYGKLWKCSECEDLSCCHENYCNNCGADMRGDTE